MRASEVFSFGSFRLVVRRRELFLRDVQVTIGSRACDLLVALVRRHGELAAKDQLITEVWAGSVVDENNLAAQISVLRKVLGLDPGLRNCIQTIPGRGYRFVAGVEIETAAPGGNISSAAADPDGMALSVIVLPFVSLSADVEQAHFSQGLSQTVATDLSRISGLLVISSATAATFEGRSVDARHISRELGVRFVLTGSVQRLEHQVRINAELIDGQNGLQLWSELFDGDDAFLLALQDRITGRIANSLGREIFVAAARGRGERSIDPKAVDFVMKGIAADNRPQTLNSLREQQQLFARAVELDPTHADALARLARAVLLQATQLHAPPPSDDTLSLAVNAAERAVTLDPGNARAHCAMGLVHVLRRDFARSVLANETAIALDRNFALAHNNLGNSLVHLGDGQAASHAVRTALRLDPRGPQVGACWTTLGFACLALGDVGEALECFSRARVANPKLPRAHVGVAISLAIGGDVAAARKATADFLSLTPHYRLSQTIDACLPQSPLRYRRFYEEVLRPGAISAGLPI